VKASGVVRCCLDNRLGDGNEVVSLLSTLYSPGIFGVVSASGTNFYSRLSTLQSLEWQEVLCKYITFN
jgi:hypothetical protein